MCVLGGGEGGGGGGGGEMRRTTQYKQALINAVRSPGIATSVVQLRYRG